MLHPVRRRLGTRSVSRAACAASLFVAMGLSSQPALASPLNDLAGGIGDQTGFNGRVVPGGASSTYSNPALLVEAPSGLTLGVFVLSQQIGISPDARPGPQSDVPAGIENATHADGSRWDNYPIPTSLLQNGRPASPQNTALPARPRQGDGSGQQVLAYQMIGLVTKLFHDQLALGAYALIPYSKFTGADAFYSDEREQYFTNSLHPELYSDRLVATSIAFAAGVKVTDQFSVGLGFTLNLQTEAYTPTYVVDAGRLQDILVDSDVKVVANLAPHMGLSYKPTPRLRLTATAHSPEKLEIDTTFTLLLANGVQQTAGVQFTHDYVPWQFGAGASYDLVQSEHDNVTVAASASYGLWSDYVDRHSEAPDPGYGWSDTLTPVAGVRVQHEAIGTFLDLEYQPTPGAAARRGGPTTSTTIASGPTPASTTPSRCSGPTSRSAPSSRCTASFRAPRRSCQLRPRATESIAAHRSSKTKCPTTACSTDSRWPGARDCRPITPGGLALAARAGSSAAASPCRSFRSAVAPSSAAACDARQERGRPRPFEDSVVLDWAPSCAADRK